jgi:hypothetical protein
MCYIKIYFNICYFINFLMGKIEKLTVIYDIYLNLVWLTL